MFIERQALTKTMLVFLLCICGTLFFFKPMNIRSTAEKKIPALDTRQWKVENTTHIGTAKKKFWKNSRFQSILESCGELCDFSIKPTLSHFMDTRRAKVDCRAIFSNEEIDQPLEGTPPHWTNISKYIQKKLTHDGELDSREWYFDESGMGGAQAEDVIYSIEDIELYVDKLKKGDLSEGYDEAAKNIISAIKEAAPVAGKNALVIGSQNPWLEAILIFSGAAYVTTLEYGKFVSNHPQLSYMRPEEFRAKYLDGSLPVFDLVLSFSSIEHSGLGRYGDALNPWGDILTVARAWCSSSTEAIFVMGCPTNYMKDCIAFNAHRVYGPVLYPFLMTNWKFNWSSGDETISGDFCDSVDQPVNVFKKLEMP